MIMCVKILLNFNVILSLPGFRGLGQNYKNNLKFSFVSPNHQMHSYEVHAVHDFLYLHVTWNS